MPDSNKTEDLPEIVNRVANSGLVEISLEEFSPTGERRELDISGWLYEGIMLREKEFRQHLKNHDWQQYRDTYVWVHCSADAIIPQWAYMLIGINLSGIAKQVVYGGRETLESLLMEEALSNRDWEEYRNKMVVIKGCGNKSVPPHAYLSLAAKLKPIVRSLMFGEACSTVPLYKNRGGG